MSLLVLVLPTQDSFIGIEISTFMLHLDKFIQKGNNFKWILILLRLFTQMVKTNKIDKITSNYADYTF